MNFGNKFKEKGEWWLPENESKKFFGELSYDPQSGILLTFFGSLFDSKNIFHAISNIPIKTIIGKTQKGKCVTLIDAFGYESGSDIILESTYHITYAIFSSVFFSTIDTDVFDLISFNLNCNEAFFNKLYRSIEVESFDEEGDMRKFKYEKTAPKTIYKDQSIEASIFFSYSISRTRNSEQEFVFNQRVFFNTNLETALDFDSSIAFAKNLKSIFSFFSTNKIYFNYLSFREKSTKQFFDILFGENRKAIGKLSISDMLITYDEIEGHFENMVKWWIGNNEFTKNGLTLYLQLLNSKLESFPQRFLSIVFALETLHSSLLDKNPFTEEQYLEFKKEKKNIVLSLEFKKRFDECMAHFNSMSFSSRVGDLINQNVEILHDYIYNIEDFVLKVKRQRNYFAHNHSGTTQSLILEEHYDYFVDVCKLIFEINFLKIVGIPESSMQKMLKRNFFHRYFQTKKPNVATER